MPHRPSDEALLARAIADPVAFEQFYRRYFDVVTGYLVRRTRRPELAADLVAETFASLFEALERFDPERGSARSWLFGIANHRLADALRRGQVDARARRRLGLGRLEITDADIERIETAGASSEVLALLTELTSEQSSAIVGHVINELSYAELAAELCCSEAVVRQRVSRGLRTIRHLLEASR